MPGGKFEAFEADLLKPGCFDDVFNGCVAVFHTASPFKVKVEDPQKDLVEPALNGTLNVLSSVVKNPSVKVFLTTSSVAAVVSQVHNNDPAKVWSEEDWNTTSSLTAGPYRYSKYLAEKAVWDWAKEHSEVRVCSLNPGFILGPVNSARADGESIELISSYLNGSARSTGINNAMCFPIVDVRDVARAHISAFENANAKGRYMLVSLNAIPYVEVVNILKEEFGNYPLPSKLNGKLSYIGKYSRKRAETELGIEFTPLKKTIVDMANSLIEVGVVPVVKDK
jgi:nucleoside-diphosphate-sugar epimerase